MKIPLGTVVPSILVLSGLYWFTASFFLAKRSLTNVSECHEGSELLTSIGIRLESSPTQQQGCWMDRRVDSLIILLVDAMRFDFAYYQFPKSIGHRLHAEEPHSRLYQFLADPPTVTMQRLKGLTTGGLPTFADISGSFGGASMEEDSWIRQFHRNPGARGLRWAPRMGFVGDDTWEDLFPNTFAESYPYPSFNTRDLDTVDNGCLRHLPDLLSKLRTNGTRPDELEVVAVHFLGVDHVGHTYGPNTEQMHRKLASMDDILATTLDTLDESGACHTALIFGDHGMTEDGNHGGGTTEETNAALFVHTTPGCGPLQHDLLTEKASPWVTESFAYLHQIDLVPTISFLLGLPVPYANLGGFVPSIVPGLDVTESVQALALNAAQVWRYLSVYSDTANRLPNLAQLKDTLDLAVSEYNRATEIDSTDHYHRVAGLFKTFLNEALELGQRVWTRFDSLGMIGGITVLSVGMLLFAWDLGVQDVRVSFRERETVVAFLFAFFLCGMLTFSNSYILEEDDIVTYCLAVLSILIALRRPRHLAYVPLLLPVTARCSNLFISGHGLDPSLGAHAAHHPVVFLGSLGLILWYRWKLPLSSRWHLGADAATIACLAMSWWEKWTPDPERNGYSLSGVAMFLVFVGVPFSGIQAAVSETELGTTHNLLTAVFKILLGILSVTGPSTAASLVMYLVQVSVLFRFSREHRISSFVLVILWRLVTRHAFFSTNHGCSFNRLQYSAAFVATKEFVYATGGISLFLNTFGWEMVGIAISYIYSRRAGQSKVWKLAGLLQIMEALSSCISVGILRRHLMVWDIYAPHFLFVAIFTALHLLSHLTVAVLVWL